MLTYAYSEAEEQKRAHKRQRQQLREERLSLAAQGRSLMLLHGRRESHHWWQPARWAKLEPELAGWLVERLKVFRDLIVTVNQAVRQLTGELPGEEVAGGPAQPQGACACPQTGHHRLCAPTAH